MRRLAHAVIVIAALSITAAAQPSEFDPSRVVAPPPVIARHFPDPSTRYGTPGLRDGRDDFASHAEALAFVREIAARRPDRVSVEVIGRSQQGRELPLVTLSSPGGVAAARPTVLILGQQHGNEPAGGEAALALIGQLAAARPDLLDAVNVLVMPRANPDGAERFARTTASGADVNRDHLLLRTPEAQAIAAVVRRHRPQVVLDLHEFTVGDRWVRKFGVVQYYDALLQAATVGQLHPALARRAERDFLARMRQALMTEGQRPAVYHTTSPDPADKVVSMGGVQPDTGRNVNGLRQAVSVLIETRGVGIGRAHFARRVHAHVTAALAAIVEAARQGPALVAAGLTMDREIAAQACRGRLVIDARASPGRRTLQFLDASTGVERPIDVEWRAADRLRAIRTRARPCGYLLGPDAGDAVRGLRALGAEVHRVDGRYDWRIERYAVVDASKGVRQDARGAIDDGAAIRVLTVDTGRATETVPPGHYFVSLAQPLGSLIAAALEPDSQNSFAATACSISTAGSCGG